MKDIGYFLISSKDVKNILAYRTVYYVALALPWPDSAWECVPQTTYPWNYVHLWLNTRTGQSNKLRGQRSTHGVTHISCRHGFCRRHTSDGISWGIIPCYTIFVIITRLPFKYDCHSVEHVSEGFFFLPFCIESCNILQCLTWGNANSWVY